MESRVLMGQTVAMAATDDAPELTRLESTCLESAHGSHRCTEPGFRYHDQNECDTRPSLRVQSPGVQLQTGVNSFIHQSVERQHFSGTIGLL